MIPASEIQIKFQERKPNYLMILRYVIKCLFLLTWVDMCEAPNEEIRYGGRDEDEQNYLKTDDPFNAGQVDAE